MYRLFSPAKALAPFVECYWTLNSSGAQGVELSERVFVDGRADMIFNFGCPYQRRSSIQPDVSLAVPCSNLDAPRENPVLIVQQGEIHLAGIRFKPGGLSAFLPVPLHELRNQVIDVDRVFGMSAAELESRLYDRLAQPEEQVGLLDKFLLGRLAPDYKTCLALHLAGRIAGSGGQTDLRLFSREIGYSPRHLDRIFQQCLGISPNFYRRIARFQKALQMLVADPGIELVELVEACGYYDQPHLSKEFNEFAGQSPNQHRAHMIEKIAGPTPPNLVHFLQDVPVGA